MPGHGLFNTVRDWCFRMGDPETTDQSVTDRASAKPKPLLFASGTQGGVHRTPMLGSNRLRFYDIPKPDWRGLTMLPYNCLGKYFMASDGQESRSPG